MGIYIMDEPLDMYGKLMSIKDELIPHYYRLATDVPEATIQAVEADMAAGANPRDTKASLARTIIARYHDVKTALAAEEAWNKQFRDNEIPTDIPVYQAVEKELADPIGLLANAFGVTKSEVRRLIDQGGIKLDGVTVDPDSHLVIRSGTIAQMGKRRYRQIKV